MKRVALLLCLLLPLVVGCSTERSTLTICSSFPLLGGSNDRAVSMSRSVQMAVDEQETVTFAGYTYNLRYLALDGTTPERNGWDAAQEERNARAAIAEHDCVAYIGTYNSGAAKISMPILNRAQMLMISPGNTYPGLTKPNSGIGDEPWIYSPLGPNNRNYCRVVPADDLQAPAAARYAADVLGVQSVYIFHDTESYGRGLAEFFATTARAEGLTIVGGTPIGVGLRSLSPQNLAAEIIMNDPDLVYFGGAYLAPSDTDTRPDPVGEIYRSLRQEGYEGYFMGADGIAETDFLRGAAVSTDTNLLATLVVLPPSELNEMGQAWATRYRSQYDAEPDAFAAPSYEAAQVVIRGLQAVQTEISPTATDFMERARPALLNAVKQTNNYDGLLGTWGFDANCDTTNTTISINRAENGIFGYVGVIE